MANSKEEILSLFDLKICTQNIQGQGSKDKGKKLKKVSKIFKSKGYNVGFFQETHTDNSEADVKKWQKAFQMKQIYFTKLGHRERGTAIVIDSEDSFRVEAELEDIEGRYFGVIGDHNDAHCLLLSVYAPYVEVDLKSFIRNTVYQKLEELGQKLPEFIVIGGDFNLCLKQIDKEGGRNRLKESAVVETERLLERFKLIDIYRVRNPNTKCFTYEKLRPTILRERLDYFFISSNMQDYITETKVYKNTISDHDLVSLYIKGHNIITRGPGLYKFNNSLVNEPDFVF
jgi:exonuclease III